MGPPPMEGQQGRAVVLEEEVDLMVLEYLAHAGFDRTVNAMKQQLHERREGRQAAWRPVGPDMQDHVKAKMLKALSRGERGAVMQLWQNFVPPLTRRTDRQAQKLEFYLQIWFAIYAAHPSNPSPQPAALTQSMLEFKRYLETDGAALAVTPEFLAYYAMPYVPEISRHPSFKDLFTVEWGLALKARLSDFLSVTPQARPASPSSRDEKTPLSSGDGRPASPSSRDGKITR